MTKCHMHGAICNLIWFDAQSFHLIQSNAAWCHLVFSPQRCDNYLGSPHPQLRHRIQTCSKKFDPKNGSPLQHRYVTWFHLFTCFSCLWQPAENGGGGCGSTSPLAAAAALRSPPAIFPTPQHTHWCCCCRYFTFFLKNLLVNIKLLDGKCKSCKRMKEHLLKITTS